jgi:hypothetical protein
MFRRRVHFEGPKWRAILSLLALAGTFFGLKAPLAQPNSPGPSLARPMVPELPLPQ